MRGVLSPTVWLRLKEPLTFCAETRVLVEGQVKLSIHTARMASKQGAPAVARQSLVNAVEDWERLVRDTGPYQNNLLVEQLAKQISELWSQI